MRRNQAREREAGIAVLIQLVRWPDRTTGKTRASPPQHEDLIGGGPTATQRAPAVFQVIIDHGPEDTLRRNSQQAEVCLMR